MDQANGSAPRPEMRRVVPFHVPYTTYGNGTPGSTVRLISWAISGQFRMSPVFNEIEDIRIRQQNIIYSMVCVGRWLYYHPAVTAGQYERHMAPLLYLIFAVVDMPGVDRPVGHDTIRWRQVSAIAVMQRFVVENRVRWTDDGDPWYKVPVGFEYDPSSYDASFSDYFYED
ncbi:hypothetical protein N658DRAFT_498834 [Parathielavia hyrcaniae]|uniref:Uncharacterized protein n=1 Tax=Parathielavia hyrcaniae TaxID=113614 RepID=A0AAN6PWE1_9PEZI|nr:hypothetical protein N658DRAFT_498834 [Parathielavia hyrcaniae]